MTAPSWRTQLPAIGAMAVLWAFFFNARLFPISLASENFGPFAPLALYAVYGISLIAGSALAVFLELQPQATRYRRICALGVCPLGILGALAIIFPYGSITSASLLVGMGTGFIALFLVGQFWYWTASLRRRDPADALANAGAGVAVFCVVAAPAAVLHAESPLAFALLPLLSLGCTLLDIRQGVQEPNTEGEPSTTLPERLIERLLVPSVLYLYLIQAVNVALDHVNLLPITNFRPWVFVFGVVGAAAVVFVLGAPRRSFLKRLIGAFNVVSVFLLAALLVTCCQTIGLLPVGNYAAVAAKITLCFFIWSLLVLYPTRPQTTRRSTIFLALYLLLVLWLPNFVQSVVLVAWPTVEAAERLTTLFVVLAGLALLVSALSNAVISSLVPREVDAPAPAPAAVPDAVTTSNTPDGPSAPVPESSVVEAATEVQPSPSSTLGHALSIFQEQFGLSEREAEIARLAAQGKTAKRIARELFIAESTAYTHLKHIYRKVGVHSKQELVDLMDDQGVIASPEGRL